MNRWMKRRIERSRARCERVENEKGHDAKTNGATRTSKPSRPTQNSKSADAHKQAS